MNLQQRYYVLKKEDVQTFLTNEEQTTLLDLLDKISKERNKQGKTELNGIFIRDTWPEYVPTLDMLSKRVDQEIESLKEWKKCEEIANSPHVDDLLYKFANGEATADTATMIVREILRSNDKLQQQTNIAPKFVVGNRVMFNQAKYPDIPILQYGYIGLVTWVGKNGLIRVDNLRYYGDDNYEEFETHFWTLVE